MPNISIAIDGPSGAGKSTIAKAIAKELKITHIDTGAIYRTIGLYILNKGISSTDKDKIIHCLKEIDIKIEITAAGQLMYLNGENVTDKIRQHEISKYASDVSAIPEVRAFLLDMQRDFAQKQSVVMDGRDIGTIVLPDADIKIFLTASPESRAQRRYEELIEKGQQVVYNSILEDIIKRDYNDTHRDIAPLKPAKDSIIVDTTGFELADSIAKIKEIVIGRLA